MSEDDSGKYQLDIDREGLLSYLRMRDFLFIFPVPLFFALLVLFTYIASSFIQPCKSLDIVFYDSSLFNNIMIIIALSLSWIPVTIGIYYVVLHRRNKRYVNGLMATFEGNYLKIRTNVSFLFDLFPRMVDEKYPLSAFYQFIILESGLMRRCGIKQLLIPKCRLDGYPGQLCFPPSHTDLAITGIKDIERIRDMLLQRICPSN